MINLLNEVRIAINNLMSTLLKDFKKIFFILFLTTYMYVQYIFTFLENNVKITAFSLYGMHALYNDNHLMLFSENDVKNVI